MAVLTFATYGFWGAGSAEKTVVEGKKWNAPVRRVLQMQMK